MGWVIFAAAVAALVIVGWLFEDDFPLRSTVSYDGLIGSPTWNAMRPRAYVVYPACEACPIETRSIDMPLGNAQDYAEIFGGKVVLL